MPQGRGELHQVHDGHLLGGAGGIESVFTVLAVHHQKSPPTINIFNQDPECDLDYCANTARDMKIDVAVKNNFGFGGTNGTLVFKRRLMRDSDLVQDIAQETFIRAYRALAQFRGDAQFYTWLYRIAVNTAKKQLMELKRDPLVYQSQLNSGDEDETSSAERELNSGVADTETPEAVLASKEIAQAVNAVMDALPEELRMAITLREIEGLSYEEIALALDCPIGTVRSRIFRAREAISTRIKPMLDRQSGKRW
jgi:RNA polymerase sigma-70 factor, ECF subfamily